MESPDAVVLIPKGSCYEKLTLQTTEMPTMNWKNMAQNINGPVRRCVIVFYETFLAKELNVLLSRIASDNTLNLYDKEGFFV